MNAGVMNHAALVASLSVAARHVRVAVNCGDHGQDIATAVEVRPNETVQELAHRLLGGDYWRGADYDSRVELQLIMPAPEPTQPESATPSAESEDF